MAEANQKLQTNPRRQEITKDGVRSLFEAFMAKANEFDLRSINMLLTNKLSHDEDIKRGTIVVMARNPNVRAIANVIGLMDSIIVHGQKGVGDSTKGDMLGYAKKYIAVVEEYQKLGEAINKTTTDAIKNEVGPLGAILGHIQDSIQVKWEVSEKQSRNLVSEYRKAKQADPELTVDKFMEKYAEEAKKENISVRELLIKQANDKAAVEREKQKAQADKAKKPVQPAKKGDEIKIGAGVNATVATMGEAQPVTADPKPDAKKQAEKKESKQEPFVS